MKPVLPSRRLVAAAIGAAAVGWGLAGWWVASERATLTHPQAEPTKPGRIAALGKGRFDAQFAAVGAAGDADAQMAAAVALAARIDPKDFVVFLENLRLLPAHAAQGLASRTVLRRWVLIDPSAALQWCVTQQRDLVAGVLDEWVRNTPPDQVVRLLDQIPTAHQAEALPSIFNVLAADDPQAAMELLARPGAIQSMHLITRALHQLALRDSSWVLERAENLSEPIRQRLRFAAAQAMVETGAAEGFSWVMAQPDRKALVSSLARNPKMLPSVLAAVAELSHEEQGNLNVSLLRRGHAESAAVVDAIAARREAIQAIDPVTRPADEASPVPLVKKLSEEIGQGFQLDQPNRLLALPEDERRQVLEVGFSHILQDQTGGPHGPWQTLLSSYPAEAARWLTKSFSNENAALFMLPLTSTASTWAAENPQAAAQWAAALPAGQSRAWAAANVIEQWRLVDEPAALAWIQSLPSDERAIASKGLVGARSGW